MKNKTKIIYIRIKFTKENKLDDIYKKKKIKKWREPHLLIKKIRGFFAVYYKKPCKKKIREKKIKYILKNKEL